MRRWLVPLLTAAGLSACGGDSMSAAPEPSALDFTAFVVTLIRTQSESAAPVAVDAAQFTYRDDDNPAAFAAVLDGT